MQPLGLELTVLYDFAPLLKDRARRGMADDTFMLVSEVREGTIKTRPGATAYQTLRVSVPATFADIEALRESVRHL
jgi:hypothetical protein